MAIKQVTFVDEVYEVKETDKTYELTDSKGETVTIQKSDCEIKAGYIFNKGMKFRITDVQPDEPNLLDENPLLLKGKQREDWLKQKQDDIMKQVNEFAHNPEDIKELLTFMSRFHNYSLYNLMLIQYQWHGAFAVASYDKWKKLGFPVKEGEKGRILVWVYTPYKVIVLDNGERVQWFSASPALKKRASNGEFEIKKGKAFKPGFVYDISQTNATPEDLPKIFPNKHYNFNGDNVNYELFLEGIDDLAKDIGTEIFWDEEDSLGSAKGAFYPQLGVIKLNKRNTPSECVKTSIHELAHALLHKDSKLSASLKELQAELTAAVVSSVYGLDTLDYSVNYISSWISRKPDDEVSLTDVLKEVQGAVKKFTYILDKRMVSSSTTEDEESK